MGSIAQVAQLPVSAGAVRIKAFVDYLVSRAAFCAHGEIDVALTEVELPDGDGCDGERTA